MLTFPLVQPASPRQSSCQAMKFLSGWFDQLKSKQVLFSSEANALSYFTSDLVNNFISENNSRKQCRFFSSALFNVWYYLDIWIFVV